MTRAHRFKTNPVVGFRLAVCVLCALALWMAAMMEAQAQNRGGGFRQPSVRPSFNNAARPPTQSAPMTPRFNGASGARQPTFNRPPTGGGGGRPGLPPTIRPNSPAANLSNFKGQATKSGAPIVQVKGRSWAIPQQGALSTRAKLLSGSSTTALKLRWTQQQNTQFRKKIAEFNKKEFVKKIRSVKSEREKKRLAKLLRDKKARAATMVVEVKRGNSKEANAAPQYISQRALDQGWKPPHSEGSNLRTFITIDTIRFARVHVEKGNPYGAFLVRAKEIEHLQGDAEKIRVYLGLPPDRKPQYISDVDVPPDTRMAASVIGAQPEFGLQSTSGFQYELLTKIPDSSFKNTRPLK